MNAFPNVHDPKTGVMSHGMSLRDYFAGQALIAILMEFPDDILDEDIAFMSYAIAEAMMKVRDK